MARTIGDKNYDEDTLKHLQRVLWDMAKDIISFCQERDIPVFASGGTAIGALRHKGFIPWDDDIDLIMLREDYNRFLEAARRELPDKYKLLEPGWNEEAMVLFAKVALKGTKLIESEKWKLETEINVDIFPYDEIPVREDLMRRRIKKGWFWCKLYCLRVTGSPQFEAKGLTADLARLAFKVIHGGLKLLGIKKSWIEKKYLDCVTRPLSDGEKDSEGRKLYTDYTYMKPEKVILYSDDIFPIRYEDFEDGKIPLVGNADAYLTRQYGDYMQLPPVEKRQNHFPYMLDFGEY